MVDLWWIHGWITVKNHEFGPLWGLFSRFEPLSTCLSRLRHARLTPRTHAVASGDLMLIRRLSRGRNHGRMPENSDGSRDLPLSCFSDVVICRVQSTGQPTGRSAGCDAGSSSVTLRSL